MVGHKGIIMTKTQKYDYDVIVVGSGMSGGHAAMEFTKKGYKVLVLDRGKSIEHGKYDTEGLAPWQLPFRDKKSHHMKVRQPLQSKKGGCKPSTKHHFIDDIDYPYEQEKPFRWFRSAKVGGKSLLWARHSYRWNQWDFKANAKDGNGVPWPIDYVDIEPWYDYVEPFIGIAGMDEDIPQLPNSKFQPPMGLNAIERMVRENLLKNGAVPGLPMARLTQGRVAHITAPTQEQVELGRGMCMRRSQCNRGCSWSGFYNSVAGSLAAAEKTGNMTLQSDAYVLEVIYDHDSGKATGVRYVNTQTLEQTTVTARVVFMCASTLATLQILKNSTSEHWPNGIGNKSGLLGHYIMDHFGGAGAKGYKIGGVKDAYYVGRAIGSMYLPRSTNLTEEDSKDTDYVRGFGYQGSNGRQRLPRKGIGKAYKEGGRDYSDTWYMKIGGFGEMIPVFDNHVYLHKTKKDNFGMALLVTSVSPTDNCKKMLKAMAAVGERILLGAGMDKVEKNERKNDVIPGNAIHEMGGAPMGNDPATSYLNKWNQSHEVANLFVTDGAAYNSQSCVNPSLTFMAMTARAVDYADKQIKKGNL